MMTTKTGELLLLCNMSSATIEFLFILAMFSSTTCYLCGIDKNLLIKINGDSIMNSV